VAQQFLPRLEGGRLSRLVGVQQAAASPYSGGSSSATVSDPTPAPGQTVTVSGAGFAPNSTVTVVLDPGEERVKSEFAGVKRSFLPLQAVLRIDEVRKQGVSKITAYEGSNVAQFPMPMYPPSPGDAGPGK
jgi:hypothetical protein